MTGWMAVMQTGWLAVMQTGWLAVVQADLAGCCAS